VIQALVHQVVAVVTVGQGDGQIGAVGQLIDNGVHQTDAQGDGPGKGRNNGPTLGAYCLQCGGQICYSPVGDALMVDKCLDAFVFQGTSFCAPVQIGMAA
jgi:hypothetical protein